MCGPGGRLRKSATADLRSLPFYAGVCFLPRLKAGVSSELSDDRAKPTLRRTPRHASGNGGRMSASHDRPGRLAVGVVGVGRVGSALGHALTLVGHTVVAAAGV